MAWEDELRTASFRGVEFETKELSLHEGKKGGEFDYPQQDGGYVEDLGDKIRHFIVQAFINGADYIDRRDALEAALRVRGSGELVHPTRGVLDVLPVSWSVVENPNSEGGTVRFVIDFAEVTAVEALVRSVAPLAEAQILIDGSNVTVSKALSSQFNSRVDGAVARAEDDFTDMQNLIEEEVRASIALADSDSALSVDDINAQLDTIITVLDNTLSSLISDDIITLAYNYHQLIRIPSRAVRKFRNVVSAYAQIYTGIRDSYPVRTLSIPFQKNQCASAELMLSSVIISLSESIRNTTFTTRADAISAINTLDEYLSDFKQYVSDNEDLFAGELPSDAYTGSTDLQDILEQIVTLIQSSLSESLFSLESERQVTLGRDYTPIDLCFELYGNIERLDELVDLNQLNDPEVIPRGTVIIYYG